jgi:adhesin/invasin
LGGHADLTGSKIISTKPVSVVSGNFCAYVPEYSCCCETLEEMEIPTYAWGKTYHVTPIKDRKKNSMIKVFAKEDKTVIYRDYEEIGFIRKAGGTEGIGFLTMRADTLLPRPIVISGDKPIGVTQYNTGQNDDNVMRDPFQMALVPIERYQKEITFHTPGLKYDLGFPMQYINLCYESDASGYIPDDIEIGFYNKQDSVFNWHKIKDTLSSKGSAFVKRSGERQYAFTTILLPEDAVYKLRADKPFQAYSYGFSNYDGYGMPASVFLDSLNDENQPPINDKDSISIYPVPAIDILIIETYKRFDEESHIVIYDLIGKAVYEEYDKLSVTNDKVIDVRGFATGVYYIVITTGEDISIKKFSVIK